MITLFAMLFSLSLLATENGHNKPSQKEEKYNPVPPIMKHIMDAHSWHFWGRDRKSVV